MTNLILTKTQELITHLMESNQKLINFKKPSKLSHFFKKVDKRGELDISEINNKITDVINKTLNKLTKPFEPKYQKLLKRNPYAQFYANYYEIISEGKKQIAIKSKFSANIKESFNEVDFEATSSAQKEIGSIQKSLVSHGQKLAVFRRFLSDEERLTIEAFITLKNHGLKLKLDKVNFQDSRQEYKFGRMLDNPAHSALPISFTYTDNVSLSFGLIGDFQLFELLPAEETQALSKHIEHEFSLFYKVNNLEKTQSVQVNEKAASVPTNKFNFFNQTNNNPIPNTSSAIFAKSY